MTQKHHIRFIRLVEVDNFQWLYAIKSCSMNVLSDTLSFNVGKEYPDIRPWFKVFC